MQWENYKPLTMKPNRFLGRCILSFAYIQNTRLFRLVTEASCTWQSKLVQAKLKVANKSQFERFTVLNLPTFSLYEFELQITNLKLARVGQYWPLLGRLGPFGLPRATRQSCVLNMQMIICWVSSLTVYSFIRQRFYDCIRMVGKMKQILHVDWLPDNLPRAKTFQNELM